MKNYLSTMLTTRNMNPEQHRRVSEAVRFLEARLNSWALSDLGQWLGDRVAEYENRQAGPLLGEDRLHGSYISPEEEKRGAFRPEEGEIRAFLPNPEFDWLPRVRPFYEGPSTL